jgi:hypothetical protein
LFALGFALSAGSWLHGSLSGASAEQLDIAMFAGANWMLWSVILAFMTRSTGARHPPTEDSELTPLRRFVGYLTLAWFVLLFMPTWLSVT